MRSTTIMDSWGLVVLAILYFFTKASTGLQRFAEQPRYTEVNPGEDALLICKVIEKRGTCSWQKDNKPVGIYEKKYEWASASFGIHATHPGGDCSLWVRSATLDFDDGIWECQVTSSDFTTQDALTSQPVRLVVRVAPQRPRLEQEGIHIPPGHNVTVDSAATATVKCVSHYGNPPALLRWYLGDQELSPLHPQTNSTEPDNPRTWSAASVVQVSATREKHGSVLKCLSFHESYPTRAVPVEARLDVRYAPTIRMMGEPQIDLEEGRDSLVLRCEADANPQASIVWRRAGRSEIASLQEALQLRPVSRRDAGMYTCQAQNSVGTSETLSVQIDVKYPPKITSAGPDRHTTAPLFSPAAFECIAEGNPTPTYKWVQRVPGYGAVVLDRGSEPRLVINNVSYDYQGEYECRATNYINGQERSVTSDPVTLQVVGAPLVLRTNSENGHTVSVRRGESAVLSLVVCADPRPRHVAWEWGSLRLEAGAGIGRYRVDDVQQDSREDCYLATLHITDANMQDARPYYLVVENERGVDRHAIILRVEEPLGLSYLLGIVGGVLAAFTILFFLCIHAVRTKKCCFKGRGATYSTKEKDSEKSDLKTRVETSGVPALDTIYTTPTGFHHHHNGLQGSPEAMKSNYTKHLQDGQQSSELVVGAVRHQRDLFSGSSLGIPDVNTHVGSVVHAFETLAHQRKVSSNEHQKYVAPQPPPSSDTAMLLKSNESGHKIVHESASYIIEKSGDESGMSNLDTLSYKIDNNYRKSGFGVQPTNSNQQTTRIPTIIPPTSNQKHYNNPKRDLLQAADNTKVPTIPIARNVQALAAMDHRKFNSGFSAAVEETSQNYENDFIRGSTVSQSFIKNVKTSKSGNRKSIYEQNITKVTKHPQAPPKPVPRTERKLKTRSMPKFDEVSQRYTEHSGDRRNSERRRTFAPNIRADI